MITSTAFQENYSTTVCLFKKYISKKKANIISYCVYFSSSIRGGDYFLNEKKLRDFVEGFHVYMSKTKTQRKDCSVRKRMKKNVKRNTYINPVVCCSCCFLLHVMLWQEVFSCLTLASRQHGVSQTCKLIITQLRMKSMWWKALCPFPFSETGSESKQQREVIPFSFCIHLRTSLP